MKVKNIISTCLCLSVLYAAAALSNNEFQQWMQQQSSGVMAQKKEFQEYKDKRDKDFTAFLKTQWKAIDIVKGEVRDEEPKPITMPVAKPEQNVYLKNKPVQKPVSVIVPEPKVVNRPVVAPVNVEPKGHSVTVEFYGRKIRFYFDGRLNKKLSTGIDKNTISDYWSGLSRANYDNLLKQLEAQKKSLQLNDWAYASLVDKLANKIDHRRRNDSALLSWFLLAKSGYKARIAYNETAVYLLVASQHEMFEVSYFTFGGKRYYAIDFDGSKQKLGRVFTYDGEYPNASKDFDMRVTAAVASNDRPESRYLSFAFEGERHDIEVAYDQGRVMFFSAYPQLNLNLYFSSGVNEETATPLQKQLASKMRGMSELQAVNFLLRFVQTSLKYETDDQQFGKENYLFPEETLFYPYSDCEDRAVLFAWLVKSLLNLDVVGLDYPGHVAAAVSFNNDVAGDSISYNGKRYVITDPTYINAAAGMTMPDFKRYKPTVIAY